MHTRTGVVGYLENIWFTNMRLNSHTKQYSRRPKYNKKAEGSYIKNFMRPDLTENF